MQIIEETKGKIRMNFIDRLNTNVTGWAHADEFADAFENYDPEPGDTDKDIPPVMAIKLAAWRRDTAERELAEAVQAAREQRLSWREVGEAIGTSGEAARQRYSESA